MIRAISLLVIAFLLASCDRSLPDFEALVADVMPGYELTEEILGQPFVKKDTYAVVSFPGFDRTDDPQARLSKFLEYRQDVGVRPVLLLFKNGSGKPEAYWSLAFPGCNPGECKMGDDAIQFTEISREFWLD